jgi:hypothetical protein
MALTSWGGTDADLFAPFFGGGFPSGALTTQRGAGNSLRGIPLDVVEVRGKQTSSLNWNNKLSARCIS